MVNFWGLFIKNEENMNIQSETGLNSMSQMTWMHSNQTLCKTPSSFIIACLYERKRLIFEDFQIIIGLTTKNKKKSRANVNKHKGDAP